MSDKTTWCKTAAFSDEDAAMGFESATQ